MMPVIRPFLSIALCLTLFISFSYAQIPQRKIDSLINKEFDDPNGPGGVFLIAQRGKPVYQRAVGKANIELGTDMATDNIFQLGSMTKQFTAVAILMLEQQSKLNVNDPVAKYIADYPNGNKITIYQLLTHTSGIKDFTKMPALQSIAQKEMSPKMMVDFFKNEPADFAPGEKFEYNNSGYVLLGYIIELASGQAYEQFITNNIFQKLGMTHSRYASDRAIIKGRAYGYQKKTEGYVNKTQINFSVPFASGSLMSTLQDMLIWQNGLNRNILLNATETKKAFTQYRTNDGKEFTYGYGWHLKDINGTATREHGGSIFGFKTMGVYIPDGDIYVLGLSNCDCHSPTQLVRDIAALALDRLKKGN